MKKMSEQDLFAAIGIIDNKYIKNAESSGDPTAHASPADLAGNDVQGDAPFSVSAEPGDLDAPMIVPSRTSKPGVNRVMALLAAAAIILAFVAGAYAYRVFNKPDMPIVGVGDTKPATETTELSSAFEVANNDTFTDSAINAPTEPMIDAKPADQLFIPEEEITHIIVCDGTTGYSRTIMNTSGLNEFFDVLKSVSGTAVKDMVHREYSDCKYSISCYSYDGQYLYSYYILSETEVREKWLGYGGRMIQSDETLPLYTYAKEITDPVVMRGAFPHPENAYDAAKTQYMILENLSFSADGYRTVLGTNTDDPLELVEVSCNVRYTNDPDLYIALDGTTEMQGYTVPITNLKGILIPARYVEEITSHDMIIIRRGDIPFPEANFQMLDGSICLPAYTQSHDIEYLAIDDGKLVFPSGTPTDCQRCFAPLYVLNEEVAKLNILSPSDTTQATEGDMPRLKMYNGMPLQEVIDYFDAFKNWKEYMDRQTD